MVVATQQQQSPARVATLMSERHRLSSEWVGRISHRSPGAGEILAKLVEVEARITARCPAAAPALIREWVVLDAGRLHDPSRGQQVYGCPYCG